MTNLKPEIVSYARVGESGRYRSILLTKDNLDDVRSLTGYAGRFLFWYADQGVHAAHSCKVDEVNGLLIHRTMGDEFTQVGTCFMQAEIFLPGTLGNLYHVTATDVIKVIVQAMPS